MSHPRKKLLIVFASCIAVIALFLVFEHFRGAWMLKRWNARMVAQGEELSIEKLTPVSRPGDDNGLPQLIWAAGRLGSLSYDLQPPSGSYAAPGKCVVIVDLDDWPVRDSQRTNATWVAVGEYLADRQAEMDAVLEALRSDHFSANIDYRVGFSGIPMTQLARIKSVASVLSAAVLHDLHQGQLDSAFQKLQGLLALPNVQKEEPIIISQLVRIAITHIAFVVTWQSLQRTGWSDDQLSRVQQYWSHYDFIGAMEKAFAMERAMAAAQYERFRTSDLSLSQAFSAYAGAAVAPTPSVVSWGWLKQMLDVRDAIATPVWKFAWAAQDEAHFCKIMQLALETHRRAAQSKAAIPTLSELERIGSDSGFGPYDRIRFAVSQTAVRSTTSAFRRAWVAQATAEIARTALAVRRYELRHGKLPRTLDALVPDFLPDPPVDYMDGKPLRYRLNSDSRFLLYSVGPDGLDGGGNASSAQASGNFQNGKDLVWPSPASAEEMTRWKAERK